MEFQKKRRTKKTNMQKKVKLRLFFLFFREFFFAPSHTLGVFPIQMQKYASRAKKRNFETGIL